MNFRVMGSNIRKSRMTRSTGSFLSENDDDRQVFITIANYNGSTVAIKKVNKQRIKLDRLQLKEMHKVTSIYI